MMRIHTTTTTLITCIIEIHVYLDMCVCIYAFARVYIGKCNKILRAKPI